MDCGKDFWGEDYAGHLKCITEDEKYGGSNYVSKENKGEKKQEEWVAKIKEKVATSQNMEPQLRELLQKIILHSNIPRKEAKFRNFMRSSCRVSNPKLMDKVWEIFKDANTKTNTTTNGVTNGMTLTETDDSGKKNDNENVKETSNETDQNCNKDTTKLNKRERKELRKEKQSKKSKKDKHCVHSNNTESGTKRKLDIEEEETNLETAEPRKKKKKRKGHDLLLEEEHIETAEPKKKKKRKGDDMLEENILTPNNNNVMEEESEEPAQPQSTSVFKWTVAIRRVLQNGPEEGLKVSKLQRKVFSLYYAAHGETGNVKSKAELLGTLHKKLNKKKEFIMYKDKVKLQK